MKKIILAFAGPGFALLNAAHAQDTSRVLNAVVVTASRSPKKVSEIGRVVTIITAGEIKQAQGKTLPELLNTVPGITFAGANNAPGISADIYLRGSATGNTLILIDGFAVNNASSTDGSYDLNAFPLDQIDHIEILKGSGSTLYGSDAVAGVINIITKHPKNQGLKSALQFSGGSYNTFKEAAELNGKLNTTGFALNLSNTDSRGFPAATDTTGKAGFRNDGFHQRAVSLNLNQEVSNSFALNGNLQSSYNTGNLPYGAFADDKNYTYKNTFLFFGLGGKLKLNKGDLKINFSQNNVWNTFDDPASEANGNFAFNQKNKGKVSNAEAIFNYSITNHLDITSGAGFKYRSTNQQSTYDTIPSGTAHNNIASVFTSLFYKAGAFHTELGGRYDHDSKYGHNFTYTFNPSVLLFNQVKVFGTVASAFKSPSLYQLFSQYGNTNLRPEATTSYEAGFDWELVKKVLTFNTVFYKYDTKNVIYFEGESAFPFGVYKNGSFQKDRGFESELQLTVNKLTASAFMAYVTGIQTDQSGIQTANLYRRPKDTYGFKLYYQFQQYFSAGLNYKYTGNRADLNFNTSPFTTVELKHYNLLDAHIACELNRHISLFADIKNLLDEKYTDWLGYNTSRLNFMAGVKFQIN